MATPALYIDHPLLKAFDATVVEQRTLPDGRVAVVLDRTCFYPTGGGQEHDTGTLGGAAVTDVVKDDGGNIVHIVDTAIAGTAVHAEIDWQRRLGNMQHHSGQHILTQAFERTLGLETVSSKINADSPSTIDLAGTTLSAADLDRAEDLANTIVLENRPIKSYLVEPEQVPTIPFRRPPAVQGSVRVVEVESFDYSACGGTHCPNAGMIGLIKIVKSERRGDKTRIYFVAGLQALALFQEYHRAISALVQQLSARPDDLAREAQRQSELSRALEREVRELRVQVLPLRVQEMVRGADQLGGLKLVTAIYREPDLADLRPLGSLLQLEPGVVAVLANYDGKKVSAAVACAADTGIKANELLRRLLAPIGGRGGGDAGLAMGGGAAFNAQVEEMLARIRRGDLLESR